MRRLRNKCGPSAIEVQSAHNWNDYATRAREMWELIDRVPDGPERDRLIVKALNNNNAMWQLDPHMWDTVTHGWSDHHRYRRRKRSA